MPQALNTIGTNTLVTGSTPQTRSFLYYFPSRLGLRKTNDVHLKSIVLGLLNSLVSPLGSQGRMTAAWWQVGTGGRGKVERYSFICTWVQKLLEKEMATHSSTLAWRISGTEEPGGLPSMGSHRVGHDWSNLAAAASRSCSLFPGGKWNFFHIWLPLWCRKPFLLLLIWDWEPGNSKVAHGDFPGGPVAKTPLSQCRGPD